MGWMLSDNSHFGLSAQKKCEPKLPKASHWVTVKSTHDGSKQRPCLTRCLPALDLGESAVIQLALERKIPWVCIDEWKARRAALGAGLNVVGVLGLLAQAKELGIINAVKPFISNAAAQGVRYHTDLTNRLLKAVGESE